MNLNELFEGNYSKFLAWTSLKGTKKIAKNLVIERV
jgi:hypothetical protein